MTKKPWYKDGLKFRCTQCGDCCTGAPGYVWVNDEEIANIAKVLDCSVGEVLLTHTRLEGGDRTLIDFANGDCTFFDPKSRKCKVYDARPRQCRTWPFWNSNLENTDTWQETCDSCRGAGKGDFFTLEEIEARARIIDV